MICFGKWMRTVACTWYFLSHALLLVRNTFPFGVLRTKIRLFTSPPPLLTLLKQLCWHLRELANAFVQGQMWCIQRSFHTKKKTGAFKNREHNSQALVMISNILKREEGEKISFTFWIWRKGNSSIIQNLLRSFQCYLVHIFSPRVDRSAFSDNSPGCGLDFVCNIDGIASSSEHKDRTCSRSTKFIHL